MDEPGWARGQQFKLQGLFKRGIKHPFQKKRHQFRSHNNCPHRYSIWSYLAPMLIYKKSVPQNIDNYPSGYAISQTKSGFMKHIISCLAAVCSCSLDEEEDFHKDFTSY